MSLRPKVALSQDFLLTISKLPPAIHSKVLKWTVQFQTHPTSNGINYEKIVNAVDPNLKSVRIDQDYRGIVFKSERDDVYVLLHVGHHDDAYRWASRRQMKVHPVTGALQVLIVEEVHSPLATQDHPIQPLTTAEKALAPPVALFAHISDEDLVAFGAPPELLGAIRAVRETSELDPLRLSLGVAPFEALTLLAAGFTADDVRDDIETRRPARIDTSDFAASLETDESRSTFYVVDNEQELTAVLNSPLAQWRIFLHPKQRRLATTDASGPMRVLGGAGTGKTVLLMHRARWLAENRTPAGKTVLVTTFTRNLANDIATNLETLCGKETLARIEVTGLDRWVKNYLAGKEYEHRIVYDFTGETAQAWGKAMAIRDTSLQLPDNFYEMEWEEVIAANGISTLDEYRTARRPGRGSVLRRKERDAIWPVFEEFRAQLTLRKMKMVDDAYRDAAALLASDPAERPYSAILVDETQDFGPMALRLLRQIVAPSPNDLFFVGDGHQRIYKRNQAAMSQCGINIVGRSRKLYLNYRTTEEIRHCAVGVLDGCSIDDLDGATDNQRGYISLSHGPAPQIDRVPTLDQAVNLAVSDAKRWRDERQDAPLTQCIIAPRTKIRDDVAASIRGQEMTAVVLEASSRDTTAPETIRLATMHRAKGLEFDRVTVLVERSVLDDPAADATNRKLLYVALTRARREARIIAYGYGEDANDA